MNMSCSHRPRLLPTPCSPAVIPTDDRVGLGSEVEMRPPSAALRFLLIAYVGAYWRRERARGTRRWQRGARAIQCVLDQLAKREPERATATASCRYQGRYRTCDVPCTPIGNGRDEGNAGGAA